QIEERDAVAAVPLGVRHDEAQIGFDELRDGVVIVALPDARAERALFVDRQARELGNFSEVGAERSGIFIAPCHAWSLHHVFIFAFSLFASDDGLVVRTRSVGDDLTSAVDSRCSQSSMPRDISCFTYSMNSFTSRCISSILRRILRMISTPARLTPRSRVSDRIVSSCSRSSSEYNRVLPSVRDGLSKPSRSYKRSVCGWMLYFCATALIM